MKRKDAAKARDILAAALEVAYAEGLAGVSMEAVAKKAGVATGTLYVYHANKEALLDALYLSCKRELTSVFRDTGKPVRLAFLAIIEEYVEFLVDKRACVTFLAQAVGASFISPQTKAAAEEGLKPLLDLLARGVAEGLLKDLPLPIVLGFLQGALRDLAAILANLPARERAARRAQIAQLCWDALKL